MAVSLLSYEVSDLCLGKPPVRSLPLSSTVSDALSALKESDESFISVWSCHHHLDDDDDDHHHHVCDKCFCAGKVCMVDIVCFLCGDDSHLSDPASALECPLSVLLPQDSGVVRHVEPHCSLLEALDLFLDGAQNLVVPIHTRRRFKPGAAAKPLPPSATARAEGRQYCWLTLEDMVRFLLNSIGLFSPLPALSVDSLGIVRSHDVLAVSYHEPAISALDSIALAHSLQTSVAVLAPDGTLVGEISPSTLATCDEAVAPAIVALSAGNLMAYIDCGDPPEDLVRAVKVRLRELGLEALLDLLPGESMSLSSSSSSSEDEDDCPSATPRRSTNGPLRRTRSASYSARMGRRAEAIVCHKGSSLVAVMIQALAHRVSYVWVVDQEYGLAGIVTFSDILGVFREHFQAY